jgi:2-oxoisovalerate dehydrogenase E1 component
MSGGRHKVLGSLALNIPPQTSTIASHLPKAVGMALSIPLAKRQGIKSVAPPESIVACSFGDASINHSTALGALNAACWADYQGTPLPLLFICEDNGFGISVPTPKGWIKQRWGQNPNLKYFQCDGRDLLDCYRTSKQAAAFVRTYKRPALLHMQTVRLMGHAGSDAENAYRSEKEIARDWGQDPLRHSAQLLIREKIFDSDSLIDWIAKTQAKIDRIASEVIKRPRLESVSDITCSLAPRRQSIPVPEALTNRQLDQLFKKELSILAQPQPLGRLIAWTLREEMAKRPNMIVLGEDVGKKGGVYGATQGLFNSFGPGRVIDTLLDEQSILGTAIGLAHNGFLPVPEIQFLAYLHNAEDQIRGEAATLPFFSNGQYTNPMVVRIAGLGYQKGFGGHFHNDNAIAVLRDIPGIVVGCPSNGSDAVRMLKGAMQFAWEQKRVVVMIEPIALYHTRNLHQENDNKWSASFLECSRQEPIYPGQLGVHRADSFPAPLCILSYGNGYYLSRKSTRLLEEQYGLKVDLMDLRWLSPLDEATIAESLNNYKAILIVDECRRSGSVSEQLVSIIAEQLDPLPRLKRITGIDCFTSLGRGAAAGLPGVDDIVAAVLQLHPDSTERKH